MDRRRAMERQAAMRKLVAEGWTLQGIGDQYKLTRERVRQIVGNVGHRHPARDIIRQNARLINRLWTEGVSYAEIGRRIGVTGTTIHKVMNRPSNYHGHPVHGQRWTYSHYGCRCDLCRKASSVYVAHYRRKKNDAARGVRVNSTECRVTTKAPRNIPS